jgi:hypothetical protein
LALFRAEPGDFVLRMNGFLEGCKLLATREVLMTPGAPDVQSPRDVSTVVPEIRRERVVVRRRRAHSRHHQRAKWSARASRRKVIRAFVVCTSVLVLMAIGLYLGLSRQDRAPAEGSRRGPTIASITARV